MKSHEIGILSPPLVESILKFRDEREWKQFHTTRNLVSALSVEAAELLEHFVWEVDPQDLTADHISRVAVEAEIADIMILLTYLVHDLGIDAEKIVSAKLKANAQKYPLHIARGSNKKYTEL